MEQDITDFGPRRVRMVDEQLVRRGVRDEAVLAAMRSVPRHLFVPGELAQEAYQDTPLPIGMGQTISQPYMVALMSSLLGIDVRSRVLEVGSGSGYQTAVLAEMAGVVFAVELLAPLAERARSVLTGLGYSNAHTAVADGAMGWAEEAPFDAILVAAAAPRAPVPLFRQLRDGGRLVIPLGSTNHDQVLTVFERKGVEWMQTQHTRCRFVPLVSDTLSAQGAGPAGIQARPATSDARTERGAQPASTAGSSAGLAGLSGTEDVTMKSVAVSVRGTVQRVYYRASAHHEAQRLGLFGWVHNEADGSVSLRLQGDPAAVDAMLDWCRSGPPAARVSRVEVTDVEPDGSLDRFEVR